MSEMDVDPIQESLFGSPPPEPRIGRSPSPLLALPASGTSHESNWTQNENVGTIALPGSQPSAELSVNPLASILSPVTIGSNSRPPAAARGSSSTRASNARAKSTKNKQSGVASRASSFTPGPAISLPDPSNPPPANFLRNQEGLLGTAGLVAGVKPSQISMKAPPMGTQIHNPIVISDESQSTTVHLPLEQPVLSQTSLPHIQFPAPSRKAIIASLIRMPDLTKILEELIKLSSSPQISHKPATFREALNSSNEAPRKRRKLDKVPAGAADWDVPFPFEYGHGPAHYMTNWAEERRKTLIGQLIALVTTATKKAAAKAYCRQHGVKAFADLVNKNSTGSAGIRNLMDNDAIVSGAMINMPPPLPHPPNSRDGSEEIPGDGSGLDGLLSSLLAAFPTPGRASSQSPSDNTGFLTFQDVNSLSSNEAVMDDWMSIFDSFSTPDKAFSGELFPASTPTPDSIGTPTFDDALDLLLSQTELPQDTMHHAPTINPTPSTSSSFETPSYETTALSPPMAPYLPNHHFPHNSNLIPDSNIDPALLALSNIPSFNGDVSSTSSPLASQSSLGPLTPQSSTWELGDITPQMAPTTFPESSQSRIGSEEAVAALRTILHKSAKMKGKQRTTKDSGSTSKRKESKQAEIIRISKERKRQLEVELERAKVEYWEMAIEQSAMMHLLQKL